MPYSNDDLCDIYDRTTGYCHVCHKKLSLCNYGLHGERGAWEVDHSVPRARGGTERRSNLYACCIVCNRSKQKRSTKVARYSAGTTRAPLSPGKRSQAKVERAIIGGAAGAVIGGVMFGPLGAVVGGYLASSACHQQNPDR